MTEFAIIKLAKYQTDPPHAPGLMALLMHWSNGAGRQKKSILSTGHVLIC